MKYSRTYCSNSTERMAHSTYELLSWGLLQYYLINKLYSINRSTCRRHSSILNVIFISPQPLKIRAHSSTALCSIMEVLNPHAESVSRDMSHGYKIRIWWIFLIVSPVKHTRLTTAFSLIHPFPRFVWAVDKPSLAMLSPYAAFLSFVCPASPSRTQVRSFLTAVC